MDHLTGPLEQLRDHAAAFMRRPRSPLLHIVADEPLSAPAVDLLTALQWLPDAYGPVIRLEQPASSGEPDWASWSATVRAEQITLATACEPLGMSIPMPPPPTEAGPMLTFASSLKALVDGLATLPRPPKGAVVLLAPGKVSNLKTWTKNLKILIASPSLGSVRWIWVETGEDEGTPYLHELMSSGAPTIACRVDKARRDQEIEGLLDAMAIASTEASGPFRAGAAWPTAGFPPHVTDPCVEVPATAPPSLDGTVLAPLLRAAKAVFKGDIAAALPLQRQARDRAVELGLIAESAQMDLLLATYAAQACFEAHADPKVAVDAFLSASARARQAALPLIAAMAELGAGTVARLGKDGHVAARSFMNAADLAKEAGVPDLRAEALRAAARLAGEGGLKERAAELFNEAENTGPAGATSETKREGR
jgi:hypothetical protein